MAFLSGDFVCAPAEWPDRQPLVGAVIDTSRRRSFRTRLGHWATLDLLEWHGRDFNYLGLIHFENELHRPLAWAWHADGTSIDRNDRGYDLIDFRLERDDGAHFFWLGKEALA